MGARDNNILTAVVEDILFDPTIYAEHNLDIKAAFGNNYVPHKW